MSERGFELTVYSPKTKTEDEFVKRLREIANDIEAGFIQGVDYDFGEIGS
jgi:hypothetical protein